MIEITEFTLRRLKQITEEGKANVTHTHNQVLAYLQGADREAYQALLDKHL